MEESADTASNDSRVMHTVDYDFNRFESRRLKASERFMALALAARAREFDWKVRQFLQAHTHGTVVNVGAGLDDLFSRADNGLATWYDIDTEKTIELRRSLIASTESDRVTELGGSVLDPRVLARIAAPADGVLFVFSGVLMYFDDAEVKLVAELLAQYFGNHVGGAQMVFDSLDGIGAHFANAMIGRSGISEADIKWTPSGPRAIEALLPAVRVVESYPLFTKARICPAWGKKMGVLARLSNGMGLYRMNRLLLGAPPVNNRLK
jgi:O-methyltransferase involved in polyketide biosynthesis